MRAPSGEVTARSLGVEMCTTMLSRMWRIRVFEETVEHQAQRGEIRGAVHLSLGQEAASVGACTALRDDDKMTGTHRSHGHPIAKGAALEGLMAELYGKVTGVCRGTGGSMHLADFSVGSLGEAAVVAASVPVAVGAGLASRLQGSDRVALSFFGDGATNEGVWHESLNLAAVWKLPVVFFCENNIYAGTTPHHQVSAQRQISRRADGYGMPGVTVDGQDVVAVHAAVVEAVRRARAGEGPSLVEALTYMYGGHAVGFGDRLGGRRPDGEMDAWRDRDPIRVFEARVQREGVLDGDAISAIERQARADVAAAVEFARESELPDVEQMWQDMYVDAGAWSAPESTS